MRWIRKWVVISTGMGAMALVFLTALTMFGTRKETAAAASFHDELVESRDASGTTNGNARIQASTREDQPTQPTAESVAARALWAGALKGARRDSLQATAQRAAVSGKVSDLIALRIAERACFNFLIGLGSYKVRNITLTPEQVAHFEARRPNCDRAGAPSSFDIPLRDPEGWGARAEALRIAGGGAFKDNDPRRKEIVDAVMALGSIELLDAVSGVVWADDAYRAGMPRGENPVLDSMLLNLGIRIAGCTARGDCEVVAMDVLDCAEVNTCVSDLRDFPAKRLFVEPGQRGLFFSHPDLKTDMLRARWQAIQAFLASRFSAKP